jgi:hypothetical protein
MGKSNRKKTKQKYILMLDPNVVQQFTEYELAQGVMPGNLIERALREYLITRGVVYKP